MAGARHGRAAGRPPSGRGHGEGGAAVAAAAVPGRPRGPEALRALYQAPLRGQSAPPPNRAWCSDSCAGPRSTQRPFRLIFTALGACLTERTGMRSLPVRRGAPAPGAAVTGYGRVPKASPVAGDQRFARRASLYGGNSSSCHCCRVHPLSSIYF